MQPRLLSSTKWTSFPQELLNQVKNLIKENFALHLKNCTVHCEGRIYAEELLLCLGYKRPKQLKQANFELSIPYLPHKDNVLKLFHLAVDVAASLLDEHLQTEDDHDLPRTWREYQVEGRMIYFQYSTTNTELEHEADRLLGLADDSLVQGDQDEQLELIKARLGVLDTDEGDDN